MLACTRIGATHSVVFGGFSADALKGRIQDQDAVLVITADGGYRRGARCAQANGRRGRRAVSDRSQRPGRPPDRPGRRLDRRPRSCGGTTPSNGQRRTHSGGLRGRAPAVHPLHLGYDREAERHPAHHRGVPDPGLLDPSRGVRPEAGDRHVLVTADIGWVTGHSYIVYGPLSNGATQVMYEGTPDTPHRGRFWELIEKYGITILYTADRDPDVRQVGRRHSGPVRPQLATVLGSVGEPINPEAWMWYREHIGANRCPIVDTWWQTETGAIMISPLPGVTAPSRVGHEPSSRHHRRRRG